MATAAQSACARCGVPAEVKLHTPAHVIPPVVEPLCVACMIVEPMKDYPVVAQDRLRVLTICEREKHTTPGAAAYIASRLEALGNIGAAKCVATGAYSPAYALCCLLANGQYHSQECNLEMMDLLLFAGRWTNAETKEARISAAEQPALEYWLWWLQWRENQKEEKAA